MVRSSFLPGPFCLNSCSRTRGIFLVGLARRVAGTIGTGTNGQGARQRASTPGGYASIPHEWYTNNDIARYEGYYASVFYLYFAGLGLDITVDDSTNHGRLDMAVRFNANVYLFELKVVEMAGEGAAMAQLKERGYAEKYRTSLRTIGRRQPDVSVPTNNSAPTRTAQCDQGAGAPWTPLKRQGTKDS